MHPAVIVLLIILGIIVAYFAMLTLFWALVDTKKEYTDESRWYRFLLDLSTRILMFLCGVRANLENGEIVPEEPFLLVSNHRSNFDPLITWMLLPKQKLIFISKPQNFHLPWFGRYIHRLRFLAIDRSDLAASRKVFMKASKLMSEEGRGVAVYPEGTRSKGEQMLPFHSAVFITAVRAGVPVVVCTIDGTEKVHLRWPRTTKIRLRCLEVIPADWIREHSLQQISDRAEAAMRRDLGLTEPPAA